MHEAASLRAEGLTFREIGERLGRDPTWVRTLVLRALSEAPVEAAEQMRNIEGLRLDKLHETYWPRALKGDKGAVKIIMQVMGRRAQLFGLDAPKRIHIGPDVASEMELAFSELETVLIQSATCGVVGQASNVTEETADLEVIEAEVAEITRD